MKSLLFKDLTFFGEALFQKQVTLRVTIAKLLAN